MQARSASLGGHTGQDLRQPRKPSHLWPPQVHGKQSCLLESDMFWQCWLIPGQHSFTATPKLPASASSPDRSYTQPTVSHALRDAHPDPCGVSEAILSPLPSKAWCSVNTQLSPKKSISFSDLPHGWKVWVDLWVPNYRFFQILQGGLFPAHFGISYLSTLDLRQNFHFSILSRVRSLSSFIP